MEKLSVEELEELREKEFDERAERDERIQNTISLFRKIACVLAVMIAAAFIFFHVRKDYNNCVTTNHQSSTARFFLLIFVKEIETYGKRNRHLLVLYVFFVLINA